jgi:rod shape-determining protein MreB
VTEQMLASHQDGAPARHPPSPRIIICVPCGRRVERRAIRESVPAQAPEVYPIEEPTGHRRRSPNRRVGPMAVDIGGTTEVGVIRWAAWFTRAARMDRFDEAITAHIRRNHGTLDREPTAEAIKSRRFGLPGSAGEMEVKGRNLPRA